MTNKISIPKVEVPTDNYFLAESDIYKETQTKAKEKFKDSKAYKTIMNGINFENGTGSQFFFNTELNLHLPKNKRVILLEDLERIYSSSEADNLFDGSFYTDTPEIILRTETASLDKNKQILEHLVKQVKGAGYKFSFQNPLRISGLELVKDDNKDNEYGISLKIGKDTRIINDERFDYKNNDIKLGKQTRNLWTKENGLSGLYLDRNAVLNADNGNLDNSYYSGRVVVTDAEGVGAQNFEIENLIDEKIAKLVSLRQEYLDKIESI